MSLKAPFLTYSDVGKFAEKFLNKYHPTLEIPIPIEWIIESEIGLHIVPIPYLYKEFGQSGFLSFDRTRIFIDEYQYDNFVEKYRFTLAHEVGHLFLHNALYEGLQFDSMQEYIEYLQSVTKNELRWFETQGDWFADQVLVPKQQLEQRCVELLESNRGQYSNDTYLSQEFWSYASNALADIFEVAPIVVEIRIQKVNLATKYRDYYLR